MILRIKHAKRYTIGQKKGQNLLAWSVCYKRPFVARSFLPQFSHFSCFFFSASAASGVLIGLSADEPSTCASFGLVVQAGSALTVAAMSRADKMRFLRVLFMLFLLLELLEL